MFYTVHLKLLRKFFALSVLSGALLLASSVQKTGAYAAAICCSACDTNYDNCVTDCYNGDPRKLSKCLSDCGHDFDDCYAGPPSCNINC